MALSSFSRRIVIFLAIFLSFMNIYLKKQEVVSLAGEFIDGYNHSVQATSERDMLDEVPVKVQQETGFLYEPTVVTSLFANLSSKGCVAASTPREAFLTAPFIVKEQALHPYQFYPLPHFDHTDFRGEDRKGGVALFQNAYVQGEHGTVFDCEKVYYPGGCNGGPPRKQQFDISKILVPEQKIDTAVLIAQFWGFGFYHAVAEDLPRVALVVDFLKAHPDAVILSYDMLTKNEKVWNSLLGLPNPWMKYNSHKAYHVNKLLVPTATSCGSANPGAVEKLQEIFFPRLDATNASNKPIILLHKRASRGLTNHNVLLAALHQKFDNCCLIVEFQGTETLEEAAALHHAASILVGPHGAGFSNAIFMRRKRAGVVEIHPAIGNFNGANTNYCQQRTALAAGLESRVLVMTKHQVKFGKPYPVEDIELVLRTVEELLATLGVV